jgi:hypothetical protein
LGMFLRATRKVPSIWSSSAAYSSYKHVFVSYSTIRLECYLDTGSRPYSALPVSILTIGGIVIVVDVRLQMCSRKGDNVCIRQNPKLTTIFDSEFLDRSGEHRSYIEGEGLFLSRDPSGRES